METQPSQDPSDNTEVHYWESSQNCIVTFIAPYRVTGVHAAAERLDQAFERFAAEVAAHELLHRLFTVRRRGANADGADTYGLADVARHVMQRTLNPRLLRKMALYDAASKVRLLLVTSPNTL
jgi:hypothetical protein